MLDAVHDACGIAGVYLMGDAWPVLDATAPETRGSRPRREIPDDQNVSRQVPRILTYLQNRGQLAAGITAYNPQRPRILDTWKDNGTVAEVFRVANPAKRETILRKFSGRAAIGHVRYATCGRDDPSYAQPFERHHGRLWKWFSFCFNGNIANYGECRDQLLARGEYHLVRDTDTEIILHHLALALKGDEKPDFVSMLRHLAATFDGAYSLAFLNADGDLVVARDPNGFRPLCFGVEGNLFAAASESLPLEEMGFSNIQNVEPGTLIHVRPDGWKCHEYAAPRRSFCYFEWVYFSNAASTLNGRSVYLSRRRMGEELARRETEALDQDCIVVPVPDTARAAADAMAQTLGIPCFEGLMRNRYLGRTFIESESRGEKARNKYTVIPEVLRGKRVFLVEDSIVRSTTLRVIISMIRQKGGAKEIHVRVACPPILAPCSYGIDMSTVSELFAPKFLPGPLRGDLPAEVAARCAADLNADSLRYLPIEALSAGIGLPENELCMGCLTGKYPTEWGNRLYRVALAQCGNEAPGVAGARQPRTYERRLDEEAPPRATGAESPSVADDPAAPAPAPTPASAPARPR